MVVVMGGVIYLEWCLFRLLEGGEWRREGSEKESLLWQSVR